MGEATATRPVLEVEDLTVQFRIGQSVIHAVNGVSFTLDAGSTLAIIGESGSGKSITAKAIMGLLPDLGTEVHGSIRFLDQELLSLSDREMRKYRGRAVALIPQDPARSLNPTISIGKQVMEAVRVHQPLSKEEARKRAVELLEQARLPFPETRFSEYPHQLSGGMRQRVVIAMALAGEPKVLIADEATTALDVTTQAQILELLKDLQQQRQMAVLLISHDMAIASSYTDSVIVMYAGRIVEHAPTARLYDTQRMPYTKALLDAIPDALALPHTPLRATPGLPPDPSHLSYGCAFAPRCDYSDAKCYNERPELREDGEWRDHTFACFHPVGGRSSGDDR
jgi:oligopeptide/dipeptide ABC transporter ATP-binding protein